MREMDYIYNLVESFPEKIRRAYNLPTPKFNKKFKKIAFFGMGGNYIAGHVLKRFLSKEIRIDAHTELNMLLEPKTLIILASYSGNTKEILNVFNKIKNNNKQDMLVVTSGGRLLEKAEKSSIKTIKLPANIHQRFTFAECFFPIVKALENSRIIKPKKKIINSIIKSLIKNRNKSEGDAKNLAIRLKNKISLFYASQYFYAAAYRLQTAIEEDVNLICHANKITELFHNEIEALPDNRFFPVLLLDKEDIKVFNSQINYFKGHIKNYYEINYYGLTREERMFLIFYFCDFLCYHLAKLKKQKMGETPISDKIKKL